MQAGARVQHSIHRHHNGQNGSAARAKLCRQKEGEPMLYADSLKGTLFYMTRR